MDVIAMNPALAGAQPVAQPVAQVADSDDAKQGLERLDLAMEQPPRPLTPVCPATRGLSYLPERPPVDIEFTDLTYTVPQGRKGGSESRRESSPLLDGASRSAVVTGDLGGLGAGSARLG